MEERHRLELTLEPADIFLLFLDLDIVRNDVGELSVDASFLEVSLNVALQVLIEVLERRTGIQALSSPVLLGGLGMGQVGLVEVGDLLDLENTILSNSLDQQSTGSGLLNSHVDTGREAGLQVTVQVVIQLAVGGSHAVLSVRRDVTRRTALVDWLVLVIQLIGESGIVEVLLLTQVLKVRNGESDTDTKQSGQVPSFFQAAGPKQTYSSLPNFLVKITSCSPGTSLTYRAVSISAVLSVGRHYVIPPKGHSQADI